MRQNELRLIAGQVVISTIKATIEDIRRSLPDFIHKFYHNGDEMRKIEMMVDEAKSNVNKFDLINFDLIFYLFFIN
jgi:hypothetical protein